jgi:hypothetical protein
VSDLVFKQFVRRPFVVEAIQITEENIHELSEFIGELVQNEGQDPYIQVDRAKVRNRSKVRIGHWMTRKDGVIHCYGPDPFMRQFAGTSEQILDWVEFMEWKEPTEDHPTLPMDS